MVVSVVGETPAVPESLRGFRVWEEAWSSRSRPGGGAHTHRPSRPGRRAPGSNLNHIKQKRRRGTTTPQIPLQTRERGGWNQRPDKTLACTGSTAMKPAASLHMIPASRGQALQPGTKQHWRNSGFLYPAFCNGARAVAITDCSRC